MPPRPPRLQTRVVWIVAVSAFAALALAPTAVASDVRDKDASANSPAVAPFAPDIVAAQPSFSPVLIGLAVAQMVASAPAPPDVVVPAAEAREAQAAPALNEQTPAASALMERPFVRPRGLLALYVSYATLQALDVRTTLVAVHRGGGVEGNPFVAPLVDRPAALVAMKAAVTVGGILAADRLAKHNRLAAYTVMFALNSAYAFVVAHNYRVGR